MSGDNPKLGSLCRLWEAKRGNRLAPSRSDFTVTELRPWIGHLMVIDVLGAGQDFRYRLYGTDLVDIFGFDLTGRLVSEVADRIGDRPLEEYRDVARLALPRYVSRVSPSSREYLLVDKLALPLAEGGIVNKILAAIYLSEDGRKPA